MKALFHLAVILCCIPAVKTPPTAGERIVQIASCYVGHQEVESNRSSLIDYWNQRMNVPPGSNYCASFVAFVLDSARADYPGVRSAVAQHYITRSSIRSQSVLSGREIPRGYIVIWKRGNSWQGHTEIVREKWSGAKGKTIGANTTAPNKSGDQRQGNGVWERDRTIDITAFFRITHFTPTY